MADDKLDITSLVTDAIKAVTDSVAPAKKTTAKKTTTKKTAAKSSTAKKTTAAKKTTTKKSTTAKKTTAKSSTSKSSAAKKTTAKSSTTKKATKSTTKKVGKIIFEIDHRQIDIDAIKKKAAKLGGDVYVVTSEKKIYDSNGKSINLF